jgi:hypothetical protein
VTPMRFPENVRPGGWLLSTSPSHNQGGVSQGVGPEGQKEGGRAGGKEREVNSQGGGGGGPTPPPSVVVEARNPEMAMVGGVATSRAPGAERPAAGVKCDAIRALRFVVALAVAL